MLQGTTERFSAPRDDTYLTPDELGRELRLSRKTIYRILQSGELPYVRFRRKIRVRREAFEEWRELKESVSKKTR